MEEIFICNMVECCYNCPFESECHSTFNSTRTKKEVIEELQDKLRRINLMLQALNKEAT